MRSYAAVLALAFTAQLAAASSECTADSLCESQRVQIINDMRLVITDRLQIDIGEAMDIAPAVVEVCANQAIDGLFPLGFDGSQSNGSTQAHKEQGLWMEFMWHQMLTNTQVDWLYYGTEAGGHFMGFRRAFECEETQTCDYGSRGVSATKKSSVPVEGGKTLVRALTTPADPERIEFWPTQGASGSDAAGETYYYYQPGFKTKERPWYVKGRDTDTATWTEPYVFAGNVLGITVSRRIMKDGALHGVLAADYELDFLAEFIKGVTVAQGSTVFILTASGLVLANNVDVTVTGNGQPVAATQLATTGAAGLIRTAAAKIIADHPSLGNPNADWSAPTDYLKKVTKGSVTFDGEVSTYDVIGIEDPKWLVVIVSQGKDLVPELKIDNEQKCVVFSECNEVLQSAQRSYTRQQLGYMRAAVEAFMQTPFAALSFVETVYNLGALNEVFCDTCPTLQWSNDVERTRLQKLVKSVLTTYTDVAWLYVGFEPQGDGYKVVGYRRNPDTAALELWTTCDGNPAGCASGIAIWADDAKTNLVLSEPNDEPWTRTWFTLPRELSLTIDQIAWTDPYVFSDGAVGLSVVKNMFEGNFASTQRVGSLAADITAKALIELLRTFDLRERAVAYLMHRTDGRLIAASAGVDVTTTCDAGQCLGNARSSANGLVAESAKLVLAQAAYLRIDEVFGRLLNYYEGDAAEPQLVQVEAVRMLDETATAANVKQNYDWVMVYAVPEESLYDLGTAASETDNSDDDLGGGAIAIIVLAVVAVVVAAFFAVRAQSRRNAQNFGTIVSDADHNAAPLQPQYPATSV